jgi:putative transposase
MLRSTDRSRHAPSRTLSSRRSSRPHTASRAVPTARRASTPSSRRTASTSARSASPGSCAVGVSPRKSMFTTVRDPDARPSDDLVQRDFTASGPDQLWVADITCVPTTAGFLYLAVVLDAWSRRIVGWAMATSLHTDVVLDALNMAVTQRQPRDVVHHSDHGCASLMKPSIKRSTCRDAARSGASVLACLRACGQAVRYEFRGLARADAGRSLFARRS